MPANAVVPQSLDEHLVLLGGIAPDRVHQSPSPGTATMADCLTAQSEGKPCELVDGKLVDKAMGMYESLLACCLIRLFGAAAGEGKMGIVSGEQGFIRLPSGQVRAPDVAFYLWRNLPGGRMPPDPVPEVVPDIAVEIVSKGNTMAEMANKRREYFAAGTAIVWMLDPVARTVAVYTPASRHTIVDTHQTLDGGDVLPNLEIQLTRLFAEVDGQLKA